MKNLQSRAPVSLEEAFPPSEPCGCDICKAYCNRPGWWTVTEAENALRTGYGSRMMLEISQDFTFGVLSPAFFGCEGNFALQTHAHRGCCFLRNGLCQLHDTGFQPLECRFCHHARTGQGALCHAALEKDWRSPEGQHLVSLWAFAQGLWERYGIRR